MKRGGQFICRAAVKQQSVDVKCKRSRDDCWRLSWRNVTCMVSILCWGLIRKPGVFTSSWLAEHTWCSSLDRELKQNWSYPTQSISSLCEMKVNILLHFLVFIWPKGKYCSFLVGLTSTSLSLGNLWKTQKDPLKGSICNWSLPDSDGRYRW